MCPGEEQLHALVQGRLAASEASSIEAHLATCLSCRRIVAAALPMAATTPADEVTHTLPPLLATEDPPVGQRYQRGELIGQGAMGSVFAAHDRRLGRKVAIKILHGGGTLHTERFQREAMALARLSHPNVVVIHDSGEDEGTPFLVMELVTGGTLKQWLGSARRGWREIVGMFLGAGRGLAAAHAAGLVHRDFKPGNVLVDRAGQPRVTDFGLVRPLGAVETRADAKFASPADDLTASGTVMGTPAYMSPEQFEGRPADARSDQFSFGVALYEALCGERPNRSDRSSDTGRARVLPRRFPRWLSAALARALSSDPGARWPSMDALLAALDRGLRRRRRVAGLAAALVVAAIAAAVALPRSPTPPVLLRPQLLFRHSEAFPSRFVTLSGDGKVMGFSSRDRVWLQPRGETRTAEVELPTDRQELSQLVLSRDGTSGVLSLVDRRHQPVLYDIRPDHSTRLRPLRGGGDWVLAHQNVGLRSDGTVVAVQTRREDESVERLVAVSPAGDVQEIFTPPKGQYLIHPAWSPDGKRVAYVRDQSIGKSNQLEVRTIDSGETHALVGPAPTFVPVWVDDRNLLVVYFAREVPQSTLTEVSVASNGELRPGRDLISRDAAIEYVKVTPEGTFWVEFPFVRNLYRLVDGKLQLLPTGLVGPIRIGGFDPQGALVLGGKLGGVDAVMVREPDGTTRLIEDADGELAAVVGSDVIVAIHDPDATRLVRVGSGAPVELGRVERFGGIMCAGGRAPPCLLAEREGELLHWFVWAPVDGKRGRAVGTFASSSDGASGYGLSPDGKTIAYFVEKPRVVGLLDVESGAERTIAVEGIVEEGYLQFMTWETNETLIATECCEWYRLDRIKLDGTRTVLTQADAIWLRQPSAAPGGGDIFVPGVDIGVSAWWASEYRSGR